MNFVEVESQKCYDYITQVRYPLVTYWTEQWDTICIYLYQNDQIKWIEGRVRLDIVYS